MVNNCFFESFEHVHKVKNELFPIKNQLLEDVKTMYHIYRSPRRTSDTQALKDNNSGTDIGTVNRWKVVEKARRKKPAREMKRYYADMTLILVPFKRYTSAM